MHLLVDCSGRIFMVFPTIFSPLSFLILQRLDVTNTSIHTYCTSRIFNFTSKTEIGTRINLVRTKMRLFSAIKQANDTDARTLRTYNENTRKHIFCSLARIAQFSVVYLICKTKSLVQNDGSSHLEFED